VRTAYNQDRCSFRLRIEILLHHGRDITDTFKGTSKGGLYCGAQVAVANWREAGRERHQRRCLAQCEEPGDIATWHAHINGIKGL
jgi:hypothetical protein